MSFGSEGDTKLSKIWYGPQVNIIEESAVMDEPLEGVPVLDLPSLPQEFAPSVRPEDANEIANRIQAS
jgi:hypothetical protein